MLTASDRRDQTLLDYSIDLQHQYQSGSSAAARKEKGQFFTPAGVCKFMAGLFTRRIPDFFRLLDPGAGVGSLTAAVCDRLLGVRSPRTIELHAFENDDCVLVPLTRTLTRCCEALNAKGHSAIYVVHQKDFILDAAATVFREPSLFGEELDFGMFDAVIMNPPYFKVSKESRQARVMRDVVHGQPNIYAFFMAASAKMLHPNGELVAITPRSFCNGLYFRDFRRWFFERMGLDYVHLFQSRSDTFRDVLQESLVTRWHRLGKQSAEIVVSTSYGRDLLGSDTERVLPTSMIIDDDAGDAVIRIPGRTEDSAVVNIVESWPRRFSELGLRVSTGPVVTFRARQFLLPESNGRNTAPLISVFNVKPFDTLWPIPHKKHPSAFKVCAESKKLLLPCQNYVLLRRFSAKEERRRLTASCFIGSEQEWAYVALENHLNYVYHSSRELTVNELYGLAAIFNSALLDCYFRTISGNTQVNATELRTMPFPGLNIVAHIGEAVRDLTNRSSNAVERIVLQELQVNDSLQKYLLSVAS